VNLVLVFMLSETILTEVTCEDFIKCCGSMKSSPVVHRLNLTWYVVLQFLESASKARLPACVNMFSAYMVIFFSC
jgi:hypothetical protein